MMFSITLYTTPFYLPFVPQASTREGVVEEGLWHPDGSLDEAKLRLLSRTYPQAVAGSMRTVAFDPLTARFQLVFAARPDVTAPTTVFLNRGLFYARGEAVSVAPSGSLTWRNGTNPNTLAFAYTPGVAPGTPITITIAPL